MLYLYAACTLSVVYQCGQHHAIKSPSLTTPLLLSFHCCVIRVCWLAGWVEGESGSAIINLIYLISVLCVGLSVCECDCVLCAGGLVVWPQTGAWGFYAVLSQFPQFHIV